MNGGGEIIEKNQGFFLFLRKKDYEKLHHSLQMVMNLAIWIGTL